ncbi:MAG: D-aminoacyl-tRNA deacylase [Chitinophagaceae bacterium]
MRAVIQRVSEASVSINGEIHAQIGPGLLVLLGIGVYDTREDLQWLSGKIVSLRIFNDDQGIMNQSVLQSKGEILLVSQFTLHASTIKGNRPSYLQAGRAEHALPLYEQMSRQLRIELGKSISTGKFGAQMQVGLINDGPVTILIDTKNRE